MLPPPRTGDADLEARLLHLDREDYRQVDHGPYDVEPGEVAEFDTRTPHWFGATRSRPVEFLSLIGKQGEKALVRKAPKKNDLE